ncbi:MAG TPA: choice-of-anchor tandem repeat NxxGxxAF-containing protein [Dokdonella sp.]
MIAIPARTLLAGAVGALSASAATAGAPAYDTIELQARSNLIVNDNGWNVPPGTSFNSISAAINDEQQVAFTAGVVPIDGDLGDIGAGLWVGGHAKGEFVAIHDPGSDPKATMIISDRPSINASGQVAYYTSIDGGTYVLRKYDPLAGGSDVVSLLPLSPSSLANPRLADDGTIGMRGGFNGPYAFLRAMPAAPAELVAWDSNYDSASPYAYLYSPETNNARQIASKVSTSDFDHNEIRLFDGFDDSRLLVADNLTDTASPFSRFDNGLGLNDLGAVAVAVRLAEGNVRAIYRFTPVGDAVQAVEIARADVAGPVRVIDSFAPDINNDGLVVFRGQDADGAAIFAGDGETLVRVAGQGDVVPTDQGPGQLGQHVDDPSSWPVFSGSPTINNAGDIAFVAGLHPEGNNQIEWGSGVFVAYATPTIDDIIFADGFDPASP